MRRRSRHSTLGKACQIMALPDAPTVAGVRAELPRNTNPSPPTACIPVVACLSTCIPFWKASCHRSCCWAPLPSPCLVCLAVFHSAAVPCPQCYFVRLARPLRRPALPDHQQTTECNCTDKHQAGKGRLSRHALGMVCTAGGGRAAISHNGAAHFLSAP